MPETLPLLMLSSSIFKKVEYKTSYFKAWLVNQTPGGMLGFVPQTYNPTQLTDFEQTFSN